MEEKSLIVYYSWVGNTRVVAEEIAPEQVRDAVRNWLGAEARKEASA